MATRWNSTGAWVLSLALVGCSPSADREGGAPEPSQVVVDEEWVDLFNGADLQGWIPKIRGHDVGDDPYGTFRVVDGLLTVSYEGYTGPFADRFGHLFYHLPLSSYELSVEYRFVGDQVEGGPDWALRNSGVMVHSQDPASMGVEQDFPISLEAQYLGSDGETERPTANLCTPGTHVVMGGELIERHCVTAAAPTFHGDVWVTVNVVVWGDSAVHHVVGADTVLSYTSPVVGGGSVDGHDPTVKMDGAPLGSGWIALQSESHPIQFRRVRVRPLGAALPDGVRTPGAAAGSS